MRGGLLSALRYSNQPLFYFDWNLHEQPPRLQLRRSRPSCPGGAITVVRPGQRDMVGHLWCSANFSGNCLTMPSESASDIARIWLYTASNARASASQFFVNRATTSSVVV